MNDKISEMNTGDYTMSYALLLLGINALNLADLTYTFLALDAGFREGNPVMDALFFNLGQTGAGLVKLVITAVFTIVAWHYRDRQLIRVLAMGVLIVYCLLFFFHLYVTLQLI